MIGNGVMFRWQVFLGAARVRRNDEWPYAPVSFPELVSATALLVQGPELFDSVFGALVYAYKDRNLFLVLDVLVFADCDAVTLDVRRIAKSSWLPQGLWRVDRLSGRRLGRNTRLS